MTPLTLSDINVLVEALDAWEKEPTTASFGGDLLVTMMGAMMGPRKETDPVGYEMHRREREAERKKNQSEVDSKVQLRKDTAILLKAKLVTIRQELMAEVG